MSVMHSVPEEASSGTEYACRAQKGFLVYATRFLKPSVLKTGFWGTEGIFGTRNPLLRYGTSHVCWERPPGVPTEAEESSSGSEIGDFAKNGHLYAPVTAAKQLQAAVGCHQATANRHQTTANCHGLPQTTANSAKLSQAAASYSQTTAEPPGPLPGSLKLRWGVSVNRRSNSMIIFARTEP